MNQNTQSAILWTARLTILAFLCAVGLFAISPLGIFLWQSPGSFDRDRLEAIVATVRDLEELGAGEKGTFLLSDRSDPGSMRMVSIFGATGLRNGPVSEDEYLLASQENVVVASKSANGALAVAICTRDLGHAGEYGYAYRDNDSLEIPGSMFIVDPDAKLDEHWCEVVNNLR